ncbi:MAG: ABC transporter permease [Acidobacteriota bacterium]
MATLLHDIRLAFRTLLRNWMISLLAIVSLALAIGGNGAVFSLVNGLLLRPYPFHDPQSLLLLWQNNRNLPAPADFSLLSIPEVADYRERSRSLKEIGASQVRLMNWGRAERPEQITVEAVTVNLFDKVLGVDAILGRTFRSDEEHQKVAVLRYRFWQDHFAADRDALGKIIRLNSEPYTIIGVMAESFEILTPAVRLWFPMEMDAGRSPRELRTVLTFARPQEGVTVEQAQQEVTLISNQLQQEHPRLSKDFEGMIAVLHDRIPDSRNRIFMGMLQGLLLCVLLIACVNIANLLLARGQDRQKELALRTAMGAGRIRIIRQLLTESLALSLLGGGIGIGLAYMGTEMMRAQLAAIMPAHLLPVMDETGLLFTLAVTVMAGLLFGLAPAFQGVRLDLVETLKEGGRSAAGGARRWMVKGLVVAEIALAVSLLAGAGLMVSTFAQIYNADPGFNTSNLLTMAISVPHSSYPDDESLSRFYRDAVERLEGLSGVRRATAASSLPRSPFVPPTAFSLDDRPVSGDQPLPQTAWVAVDPGYLETLGISLLRGRSFDHTDRQDAPGVALISRSMAARYWPEEDALGQRFTLHGRSWEIVGITADVLQAIFHFGDGPQSTVYVPQAQLPQRNMSFILHTQAEPHSLDEPARRAIESLDADLSVGQILTLDEFVDQFFAGMDMVTAILDVFGALALVLASVGIYGVLAYSVAQRRHEIGVRMACGAQSRNVLWLILRQGATLTALGFVLALPLVLLFTYLIVAATAGFADAQPQSFVNVMLILLAVIAAATYLPARRAARVDPVVALRD